MNTELSPKEKIRYSALLMNSKLQKYVKLHNDIFNTAATFRSLAKNILLGKRINFKKLWLDSVKLTDECNGLIKGLEKTNHEIFHNFSDKEKEYWLLLLEYARAVYKTICILCKRQEEYYRVSSSNKNSTFKWSGAQKISKEYQQAINEYLEIGAKLNNLNYVIFE